MTSWIAILETSKELIKKKEKQRKVKKWMLFLIDVSSIAAGICIFIFFCSKRAVCKGEKRMNSAHYLKRISVV